MKRNFQWWESLKHIAGFRDMRNGTYRMVNVQNPRTVQTHSRPTLNCESETELFPITCSAYKEAYKNSGIDRTKALIDQGDGNLIPNIKDFPVWTFEGGSLVSIGAGINASVCLNEPTAKKVKALA